MRWTALLALALSLSTPSFAQPASASGLNFYSLEAERRLGHNSAAALEGVLPLVEDAGLNAYVQRLGAALAAHAASPFTFSFTLYEDRRTGGSFASPASVAVSPIDASSGHPLEPLAVAGGPIFVPMSLLAAAPSESALAFQLAHAMAHIAARHATRNKTRAEVMQTQEISYSSGVSGIPMGSLSFSRANEREADYLAVQILAKAGFDPEAAAAALAAQPAPPPGAISRVFQPRPPAAERAQAIRSQLAKMPPTKYQAATGDFAEAKARAAIVH